MSGEPVVPDPEAQARGFLPVLAIRVPMAAGAAALGIGGLLLVWEGGERIVRAIVSVVSHAADVPVSSAVMKATDESLFGIVLLIFAANIVFGFCMDARSVAARGIPHFMKANSLHELKSTFGQVVILYLIVDFATDVIADINKLDVNMLVYPLAILIVAVTLRLSPDHGRSAHKPDGQG